MIEGARVLLAGGAGFLGTALAGRLLERNEVRILDTFRRDALGGSGLLEHPRLEVQRGDITSEADVRAALRDRTHVIHLASVAGVGCVRSDPAATWRTAVLGTEVLARQALRVDGLARFLLFSTSEVYGADAGEAREDGPTPIPPVGGLRWIYAAAKLAAEHLCLALHRAEGLPAAVIRPFNVYGPGQVGEGAVVTLLRAGLAGGPLEVRGTGEQIRAWCYVDDLVDGTLACLTRPEAVGEAWNLGNPSEALTTLELVQRIGALLGSPEIRRVEGPPEEVERRIPSLRKATDHLGFVPKIPLHVGLPRTLSWLRVRLESRIH